MFLVELSVFGVVMLIYDNPFASRTSMPVILRISVPAVYVTVRFKAFPIAETSVREMERIE